MNGQYRLSEEGDALLTGLAIGEAITSGKVKPDVFRTQLGQETRNVLQQTAACKYRGGKQPGREAPGRRTARHTGEITGERARKTARVSAATEEAAGGGAAEPPPGTADGRTAANRSQSQTTSSAGETSALDDIMNTPRIDNQEPVAAIRGSVVDVRLPQRLPNINHLIEMGERR